MSLQESLVALSLRFITSGGLATGIHWLTMWLLVQRGIDATVSTAIGAAIGAAANYLLQYYHTFRCRHRHSIVLPAYLKACLAGWVANIVLFYLLYHFLIANAAWAQFITTALVTLLNFYMYKKVVFHERHSE